MCPFNLPVSGAMFLTGGVFERDISHCRSVAVLCMLYKIRCNPVHPPNGALPGPYVPVRATRGDPVAHRNTYAPPRSRTLQYNRLLFPSRCPILLTPCGFQEQGQCFFIGLSCSIPTIVFYSFSLSRLSVYGLVLWGWGLRTDRVYITLSLSIAMPTFFNNNNKNNNNKQERGTEILSQHGSH